MERTRPPKTMRDIDPRLVRLLARHFNDLHGLSYALASGGMICFGLLLLYSGETVAVFAGLGMVLLLRYPINRLSTYYRSQFGRVKCSDRPVVGLALMAFWLGASLLLSPRSPVTVSAFWLLAGLGPLWLMVDGWPFRWYEAFNVVAALLASYLAFSSRAPAGVALGPGFVLAGSSGIIVGLADHALLVRATRAPRNPARDTSPVSATSGANDGDAI
jgi:hypothetical protein